MYYYDFNIEQDQTELDACKNNDYTSLDICSGFRELAKDDENLLNLVNQMITALNGENGLIVHSESAWVPDYVEDESDNFKSLGLVFVDKTRFIDKDTNYQKYQTLQSVYQQLAFDKKTGWSQFLLANDTSK